MKKLSMISQFSITFEQGCDRYILNCKQRNLRQGTINHYKQSYVQFYKYFDRNMLLSEITERTYKDYVVYLCDTLENDVSVNSYLRDLITTFHFWMNEGYIPHFKMQAIKVDKHSIETYSDGELKILLQKPDLRKCKFTEYQCWVQTNFLFSTGVRQRSLINIRVKDVDLFNNIVNVNVTKSRKALVVPISQTMANILKEYLTYRQHETTDDYLFCNVFGKPLTKSANYHQLYVYNKNRGVETTGIHRYRHTFAKQWILNGGNVVALQKILGHSNLAITQNYINMLVSETAEEVNNINLIDKFVENRTYKMNMRRQ
ncbi:MAG: tyrosine-type recombinase/integrase [Clostridia bacterium]|nr:tyrosine-type recombinase/integrase [Clostridia bacterium]